MTDHKFTDEEILEAMKHCVQNLCHCAKCPRFEIGYDTCHEDLYLDILALINRQSAEIERLRKYYFTHDYHECHNEAIKEFAERLKGKAYIPKPYGMAKVVDVFDIDTLVKEMTEEQNESQNT